MQIFIYVVAGLFSVLALGLIFAFVRSRESGLVLMALTYGISAGSAIALLKAWPLLAGFAVAWAIRLMGADGDPARK